MPNASRDSSGRRSCSPRSTTPGSRTHGGGSQPRWSGNGREIHYRGEGALVAVAFAGSGGEPVIGRPTVLFKDEYDLGQALLSKFDVTPNGRFLLLRRDAGGAS
jgi:hypothetical protein